MDGTAVPDDRRLMAIHARVLFRHDRRGRIRVVNERPYPPAPRLFVGLTRADVVVRWRDDADRPLAEAAARLLQEDEAALGSVLRLLEPLAPGGGGSLWLGPAYVFPAVASAPAADVVRIGPENAACLSEHFPYGRSHWRAHAPYFARVVDGRAVAVCRSARQTSDGVEAGLFTVLAHRGRGYGGALARAWAAAVQADGRLALYSTSAQNLASQGVARSLGLRLYGIDVHAG